MPDIPVVPSWATATEHPDAGSVEFIRPVGRVACADSHEELSVELIQRDSGPVCVSLAGMRLGADEADLLFRVVRNAVRLIPVNDRAEPPGERAAVMSA